MSKYSPTVLPEVPDATANFASRFADVLRKNQEDADAHTSSRVSDILRGLRNGAPPAEGAPPSDGGTDGFGSGTGGTPAASATPDPTTLALKPAPAGKQLSDALGVGADPLGTPAAPGAQLSRALRVGAPALGSATSDDGAPTPASSPATFNWGDGLRAATAKTSPVDARDARTGGMAGTMTPGAFDPVSASFATAHGLPPGAQPHASIDAAHYHDTVGDSPTMHAMVDGMGERYVLVDPRHPEKGYVDTQAGSGLMKALVESEARTRAAELAYQGRAYAADRGAGSREAVAGGKITAANSGVAAKRAGDFDALVQGGAADADEEFDPGKDYSARVSQLSLDKKNKAAGDRTAATLTGRLRQIQLQNQGRVDAAGGGNASGGNVSAGAVRAQRTRDQQADAIMQQFDGDRAKAEDFITNDPQGKGIAKQSGLTSNDLYLGEGRYKQQQVKAAGSVVSSGAATAADAGGVVRNTRAGVLSAADRATVSTVLQRIKNKQATAEDVDASSSLSDSVKAEVKRQLKAQGAP